MSMKIKDEFMFTEEQLDHGRRFVMHWSDFTKAIDTLPDYEVTVRNLIVLRLGYLPPTEMVYVPYEPYLRTIFAAYDAGKLAGDVFLDEADDIIKKIRNDDLKKHRFAATGAFSADSYQYYDTHLPMFKAAARQRLSKLLGYKPLVKHSLYAETHMRQLMQEDYYHDDLPLDKVDHRSFTIYHYSREAVENGMEAADASPLVRITD